MCATNIHTVSCVRPRRLGESGRRGAAGGGLKIVIDFAMRIFYIGNLERPDLNSLARDTAPL